LAVDDLEHLKNFRSLDWEGVVEVVAVGLQILALGEEVVLVLVRWNEVEVKEEEEGHLTAALGVVAVHGIGEVEEA
jgi:hypothetical protein